MANKVRASHILVETEQEANDLKAKITSPEDFAAMAVAVPSVAGKVIRKTWAGKRVFSVLKIENWFSAVFTHAGAKKKYV